MIFRIISDSSSNLLSWDKVDYKTVPLKILSSEKEYIDNAELDVAAMVADLKTVKGAVKTSCPNTGEWLEAFEGADCIFAVTITSNLSGCYNAAMLAREQYITEHPEVKIHVVDSYSTGGEMQLIIEKLAELINEGKAFEEIEKEITAYKDTTHLEFSLQSLTNLARNGRVSPAVAAIAGVLGIRVVGAAVEGTLHPSDKVRGEKKAISTIFANMKKYGYVGGKVRINHCLNPESAAVLKEKISAEFPSADIEIVPCTALCRFYAEQGGMIIGYEGANKH
ncbi:MAG: DegV family protein [Clostridia bacterium]|nr:DegV family protein [Clostridia bacterium]